MVISSLRHPLTPRPRTFAVTLLVSILIGGLTLLGTLWLNLAVNRPPAHTEFSAPLVIAIMVWFSLWFGADLLKPPSLRRAWHEIPQIVSSALRWGGVMLVLLVFLHAGRMELSLVGTLVVLGIPARIAVCFLPAMLISIFRLGTPPRVLIVGSGSVAQLVAASLLKYDAGATNVVGFVDDRDFTEEHGQRLALPTFEIADLDRVISTRKIDHVVFAFSRLPDSTLVNLIQICQSHPDVEVTLIPRFYEAMSPRTQIRDMHGIPSLGLPSRRRYVDRTLKAVFDRLFAAIALVVVAPFLVIAAIAIRVESRGPILFRQERVGPGGKKFNMYKLRSMREPVPGEHLDASTRYTGVGALLRKYSIDELPQLINVLRGDMSLVGPRPEREEYVRLFTDQIPGYQRRHTVRGGITGLAQVMGSRGDTSIVERTRLDNFYVEHWSGWFDIKIILLTFTSLAARNQGIGGASMFLDIVAEVALGPATETESAGLDIDLASQSRPADGVA
jgi:exopolysaccharide biosynthesis polyprenyl glycosylphosphotransferase